MREPLGLLIKPAAGLCNLRCKYCFYHDLTESWQSSAGGIMTRDTMRALIDCVFRHEPRAVTFAFQGGEPTLAGLDYFRDFTAYVDEKNRLSVPISFAIQTNGVIIDDEWARFLASHRFLVGLSLDGTREVHDSIRMYPDGHGSFKDAMRAAAIFKKYSVDFNILCVLSSFSARHPDKIYGFAKKNGFGFLQFIPCLDPFGAPPETSYAPSPKQFADFQTALFRLWRDDILSGCYISIRYFDNLVRMASGQMPEQCGLAGFCPGQWVIESDGGVYPCDFYVADGLLCGNVNVNSFTEMSENPIRRAFIEESSRPREGCDGCRFLSICRGGCRRDCQANPFDKIGANRLCEGYKLFFAAIIDDLPKILRKFQADPPKPL